MQMKREIKREANLMGKGIKEFGVRFAIYINV